MVDHRCARTRRADDCFCLALLKVAKETPGQLAGLGPVTSVKGGLTAARLSFIKFKLTTETSQNFDGTHSDRGPELVNETGYEKRNEHFMVVDLSVLESFGFVLCSLFFVLCSQFRLMNSQIEEQRSKYKAPSTKFKDHSTKPIQIPTFY